jgi:hypothetical protein
VRSGESPRFARLTRSVNAFGESESPREASAMLRPTRVTISTGCRRDSVV